MILTYEPTNKNLKELTIKCENFFNSVEKVNTKKEANELLNQARELSSILDRMYINDFSENDIDHLYTIKSALHDVMMIISLSIR